MDLAKATTLETLKALESKEVSSVELLTEMIQRVERFNPSVNAIVASDPERALVEASAADDERTTDDQLGPLHGLPITVKDCWETSDLATTAGARKLKGHMADRDADVIRMLRRDGAIVWAKTNVPLYASDHQTYNDLFGTTNNPWDLSRTSGGSSGGSAVSVACGFTTAEVGSDIAGSIRQPAAFNGVFGLKTTHGLISGQGHIPGPPGSRRQADLGVYGPIGRSCGDLRAMLRTLTKSRGFADAPNARMHEPTKEADIAKLRLGLWLDHPVAPVASSMKSTIAAAMETLAENGALIDSDVRPAAGAQEMYDLYTELLYAELSTSLSDAKFVEEGRTSASDTSQPHVQASRGSVITHRDWIKRDEARWQLEDQWYQIFESFDAMITPVAPVTAFPHCSDTPYRQRNLEVNGTQQPYANLTFWPSIATLPLLPAVTIPVGTDENQLPVGVQIIGSRWSELRLLDIAEEIASVLGQRFTAPPLVAEQF